MGILLHILISGVAVLISAYLLPGVHVDGFVTALIVAIILGLLNAFLKPLLVILTLPVTLLTLGLFLFVINALIVLLAARLVSGFQVDGFLWALIFSLILTVVSSLLSRLE